MKLLETNGLEDAVLIILPGEEDNSQESGPSLSEQWVTPTFPVTVGFLCLNL